MSTGTVSSCVHQVTGMSMSRPALDRSEITMTGRFGLESSQAPTNKLISRYGRYPIAVSTPISISVACSRIAAITTNATSNMFSPNIDAV